MLKTAAAHHVPVMPIVALMTQAELHKLFTTESAETAFINALLSECKKNRYSGFQFDFENVNWTDRDLLTALVAETAAALHKEHLQLTIATVPNAPGYARARFHTGAALGLDDVGASLTAYANGVCGRRPCSWT